LFDFFDFDRLLFREILRSGFFGVRREVLLLNRLSKELQFCGFGGFARTGPVLI